MLNVMQVYIDDFAYQFIWYIIYCVCVCVIPIRDG